MFVPFPVVVSWPRHRLLSVGKVVWLCCSREYSVLVVGGLVGGMGVGGVGKVRFSGRTSGRESGVKGQPLQSVSVWAGDTRCPKF